MKTQTLKSSEIVRDWHLVDAEGKTLGRLASSIAQILRGKNKVNFSYHLDMSDFVVVINADKIVLTGRTGAGLSGLGPGYGSKLGAVILKIWRTFPCRCTNGCFS